MDQRCPTEYWIWMSLAMGPGVDCDELLERFGDPKALYIAGESGLKKDGIREETAAKLAGTPLEAALSVLEQAREFGCRVLTPDDAEYPARLRNIYAYPVVLYVRGTLPPVDDCVLISMVGTRRSSKYGEAAAAKIASGLAEAGAVVVSGMADGIDAVCHESAIRSGGLTVAVLGCGIDVIYPAVNKDLYYRICEHGAVITEHPPGAEPAGRNFPVRNRIIAGLSLGVVVVEGSLHSGSLITANHAIDQGKEVFAVPGSIFKESLEGNHRLLKQGAIPVVSAADIIEEYEFRYLDRVDSEKIRQPVPLEPVAKRTAKQESEPQKEPDPPKKAAEIPDYASKNAKALFALLTGTPQSIDDLTERSGIAVGAVSAALTELELYDAVRIHPGKCFSL